MASTHDLADRTHRRSIPQRPSRAVSPAMLGYTDPYAAEILAPPVYSWPVFERSLDTVAHFASPRLGRWIKSLLVKAALFWLSISVGFVILRWAYDGFARSLRRA
jgi:hypothetical protein